MQCTLTARHGIELIFLRFRNNVFRLRIPKSNVCQFQIRSIVVCFFKPTSTVNLFFTSNSVCLFPLEILKFKLKLVTSDQYMDTIHWNGCVDINFARVSVISYMLE